MRRLCLLSMLNPSDMRRAAFALSRAVGRIAPGDGKATMQGKWQDRSVAAFRILSPTRNHKRLGPVKNAEDYRSNLLFHCRANRLLYARL